MSQKKTTVKLHKYTADGTKIGSYTYTSNFFPGCFEVWTDNVDEAMLMANVPMNSDEQKAQLEHKLTEYRFALAAQDDRENTRSIKARSSLVH